MRKWIAMVAAVLMVVAAGTAMADTTTVQVSATVEGTCLFSGTGTLAFGVLPTDGTGATTNTSVAFTCSNGTTYQITDDRGLHEDATSPRMSSTTLGTPAYIPYTISYSATGQGTGTPASLSITGNVPAGFYTTQGPDIYEDTVTLTILP